MSDKYLSGKVVIVTGASAGIGRSTALALADAGAAVVLADVDEARGEATAEEIVERGGDAIFVETDVADAASVEKMVAAAVERFGGLDAAFNNAGIEGTSSPLHESSRENWDRVIAINLTGVWNCMRYEIPAMLERGGGSIVNCSSVAGLVGFANSAPYVASKHGVVGLTKTAALEYGQRGIRVNAVCPGVIATEMIERFTHGNPDASAALLAMEPVGRLGEPSEIADAVAWLCSDRSSFVTGQALAVDGGFVAA